MTVEDSIEEYFPRGGKGGEIKKKRNFVFEKKNNFDGKLKKPGRRERQKKAKKSGFIEHSESDDVVFERFEPLVYKGLSEGTLALCSVREVHEKYVDISMPGRVSARLYIENVSEPYYNIRNKQFSEKNTEEENEEVVNAEPLSGIFRIGQHINCSVLSVKKESHYIVRVTSDPAHVNRHMTFDNVRTGSLVQMAVQSVEDHGYMMFSGISGLVSFLPKANAVSYINDICNFKSLAIGQVVWCLVTKSKLSGTSNTVQVTLDTESIQNSKLEDDISITLLNPGIRVDVSVDKIISQNLFVTVGGTDIHGYIEESQLSSLWSKPEDYKIGSLHTATVLYKFPYARIVALTLKSNVTTISKEEIKHGTIFERAEIMCILKRGVCLKLESNGKTYKGMISVRRLGENVDYVKMSTRFPIGNHIKCRVIGFDALEQVYSCSTEDNLLNEKFLSKHDLSVGQLVDVRVESLKKSGVEVSVGAVKGHVPALHICDVVIQNPFDKITLKSKHKAKVLKIEENKVIFTLRPTLVKTRSLTNFQSVEVGDSYYGWVNKILPSAITVSFFGGLFAHIKEEDLLEHPHKYTFGELVKCYVVEHNEGRMPVFSLLKSVQNMTLTVGNTHDLIVKKVSKEGLTCLFMSKGQNFNAFIPLAHFCDYYEFCEKEMNKYQHGSVINNALLFSLNEKLPLFTLRQSAFNFFKKHPEMSGGFRSLKKNMLLPCSVSEILPDRILVCAPIPGFNGKIPITIENLSKKIESYSIYEGLVTSVSKIYRNAVEVVLSCHLDEEQKIEWSLYDLENFLNYMKPQMTYKIGEQVECKVKEVKKNSLTVSIPSSNHKGIIRSNTSQNYQKGQLLKAVVLYHDVKENLFYLHVEDENISLYNPLKASLEGTVVSGTVLQVSTFFIIALINDSKAAGNIVFLPVLQDPNDPKLAISMKDVPLLGSCEISLKLRQTWTGEKNVYFWLGFTEEFGKKTEAKKRKTEENIFENSEKVSENNLDESEIPKKKKKLKKQSCMMAPENSPEKEKKSSDLEGLMEVDSVVDKKKKRKQQDEVSSDAGDSQIENPTNKKSKGKALLESRNEEDYCIKRSRKNSFTVENDEPNSCNEETLGNSGIEHGENVSSEKKKKKKKKKVEDSVTLQTSNTLEESLVQYVPESEGDPCAKNATKNLGKKTKLESRQENSPSGKNKSSEVKELTSDTNISSKTVKSENGSFTEKTKKKKKKELEENTQNLCPDKKKIKKESNCSEETSISLEDVGGFLWDATAADLARVTAGQVDEGESSQDSEEETLPAKKLTPAEKRAAAFEAERRIREKEEELMIAENNPQSAEHFDRLLTANPNSSKLWIMYMAHHMQATEIEKARSVAKRALKHINVRLEDERLNIWIASLNLENIYGTPESFKEVLSEALKYNDDYKVYKRVLDIYADSNKISELETLANQLIKKYKSKLDCWIECQAALMKAGLHDKARNYLQRSLEILPTKDYCTLVSRFALIENKYGFPDQAHSLFENLLTSYPKRTDVWFVYVDMLTKAGTPELARNVLARATAQKLPIRKMKALYQKWIKFEEAHGTPEKVEEVKEAATNYVKNLTSALKEV